MNKQWYLMLIFLGSTSLASAQSVPVTSGEHGDFTRIVLELPKGTAWTPEVGNNEVSLIISLPNLRFQDTNVFQKLTDERISHVSSRSNAHSSAFVIALNCECDASTSSYLNRYIVVDIQEKPTDTPAEQNHQSRTLDTGLQHQVTDELHQPIRIFWSTPDAPNYTDFSFIVNFPADLPKETVGMTPIQSHDDVPDYHTENSAATEETPEQNTELEAKLIEARTRLVEQLTLAAEDGYLEFLESTDIAVISPEITPEPTPIADLPPPPVKQVQQWSIQTAQARDAGLIPRAFEIENDDCKIEDLESFTSWGTGTDFSKELAVVRGGYVKEFDTPDIASVEGVIHTYLRYGFGLEALTYLHEFEDKLTNSDLLAEIAHIVEGQSIDSNGTIGRALNCGGLAGLWAVVGVYPSIEGEVIGAESIVQAFSELPLDLRRLLGPRLSLAFRSRGILDMSDRILKVLERAPGDHGAEFEISVAHSLATRGDVSEAEVLLQQVAKDNTALSATALLEFAQSKYFQGEAVSNNTLSDLGAAADIARGKALGRDLRRMEILWTEKNVGSLSAFNLLEREQALTPNQKEELGFVAYELFEIMSSKNPPALTHVEAIERYSYMLSEKSEGDHTRESLAEILLGAGMPNLALEVLAPMIERRQPNGLVLAARAFLMEFDGSSALDLLSEETGQIAGELRVQAHLGLGEFQLALEELGVLSNAKVVRLYWYPDDWMQAEVSSYAAREIRENHQYFIQSTHLQSLLKLSTSISDGIENEITLSEAHEVLLNSNDFSDQMREVVVGN